MSEHAMVTSAKVMSQSMKSTTFVSGAWCALPRGSALSIVLVLLIAHIRWVGTSRGEVPSENSVEATFDNDCL